MGTYLNDIAPWEQYPKHLRFCEIMDPLTVITNFFSAGSPNDHRRNLKAWRYYVVSKKYYKDRHGAGHILFIHDENVRLIEAMHILLLNHQNVGLRMKDVSNEQITQEKSAWVYFPKNLAAKEWADPYKTIKKCFKKFNPQEYRDYLHEWLQAALYNHSADEAMTAGEIIELYDNIRKLYSAAWLIYQRETDQTIAQKPTGRSKVDVEPARPIDTETITPIRGIDSQLSDKQKSVVEKIKDLITERIPGVDLMYFIGKNTRPSVYFFLVLVNDHEKADENGIVNKIEDNCRCLGTVFAIVHKMHSVIEGLNRNKRFWHDTLYKSTKLYQAPGSELLRPQPIDNAIWAEEAKNEWNRWGLQGKEFMKGAVRYIEDHNYTLALFSLHQAIESSLIGIIQVVLGYRISVHNLPKMIKMTLLFTDEIRKSFHLDTVEGVQLFNLLQMGYAETRYKMDFNPNEQSVKVLKDKVEMQILKIEQMYQRFINK